jgi:hypothetical protein
MWKTSGSEIFRCTPSIAPVENLWKIQRSPQLAFVLSVPFSEGFPQKWLSFPQKISFIAAI